MPVFLYIPPHAQTRQSFESVGLFLLKTFKAIQNLIF